MKKYTPFPIPAGTQPVRIVHPISHRDPNFYEAESGDSAREEPLEPMEIDTLRDMPGSKATTGGMPFAIDEKLSRGGR